MERGEKGPIKGERRRAPSRRRREKGPIKGEGMKEEIPF